MFTSFATGNVVNEANHSSTKNHSVLESALTAWITARKLLSGAVVAYRSTHNTLRAICVQSSHSSSQHRLEEVFASIEAELDSISAEEQTLKDIRISLLGLRNQSILLSPVNKLPPEILGHIFSLSRKHCVFEGDKKAEPIYFTSVCARWRQVALNTTKLWAHIDLQVGSTHQLASLMLERTRNNPIHVHVYDDKLGPDRWRIESQDRIGPTIAAIEPYIRRAYSLRIESLNHETELSSAILDLWFRNVTITLAKHLIVSRPRFCYRLHYDQTGNSDNTANPPENMEAVLCSLETLHLNSIIFDWGSGAFCGLVDLRLHYHYQEIHLTLLQLYQILHSNPLLETLELAGLKVQSSADSIGPSVLLSHIKTLNLIDLEPKYAKLLIPLVALPRTCSELSVGLSVDTGSQDVVKGFLRGAPITSLCLYGGYEVAFSAWPLITTLELPLSSLVLSSVTLDALDEGLYDLESDVRLLQLTLNICTVTLQGLESLVRLFSVKRLHFRHGSLQSDYIRDATQHLAPWLERHPELQCLVTTDAIEDLSPFDFV